MVLNFKRLAIPAAAALLLVGGATATSATHRPSPSPSETSIVVTPPAPLVNDVCDTENDTLEGVDVTGITYGSDGWPDDDGTLTLNLYATADNGYKLEAGNGWALNEGGVLQYSHTFSNEPCSSPTPSPTPTATETATPTPTPTATETTQIGTVASPAAKATVKAKAAVKASTGVDASIVVPMGILAFSSLGLGTVWFLHRRAAQKG